MTRYKPSPSIIVLPIPFPVIYTSAVIAGRSEVRVITPPESNVIASYTPPDVALAWLIAQRSVPSEPSSNKLVTMMEVGSALTEYGVG